MRLPHDPDAEASVLGSMLLDSGTITDIKAIVGHQHFFREAHQIIFSAISSMHRDGRPVDTVLVRNEIESRGQLDAIGGAVALVDLLERVSTMVHVNEHARIVRRLALRRAIVRHADGLMRAAIERPDEICENARLVRAAVDRFTTEA